MLKAKKSDNSVVYVPVIHRQSLFPQKAVNNKKQGISVAEGQKAAKVYSIHTASDVWK